MVTNRDQESDIKELIDSLNDIRLSRQEYLQEANQREEQVLGELRRASIRRSVLQGRVATNGSEVIPPLVESSGPLPAFSIDVERQFFQAVPDPAPSSQSPVKVVTYEYITFANPIKVNDRVRIHNDLTHVKGREETEADRWGRVDRTNKRLVTVETDNGDKVRRARKNLRKVVIHNESGQADADQTRGRN